MTEPPVVVIARWLHAVYGESYSIEHDGKAVMTASSELEARRVCRQYGWVVTRTDMGEIFQAEETGR